MGGEVKAPGIADGPRIMFQEGLDAGQEGGVQGHGMIFRGRSFPDKNCGRRCGGMSGSQRIQRNVPQKGEQSRAQEKEGNGQDGNPFARLVS